jgi:hypothetical protein
MLFVLVAMLAWTMIVVRGCGGGSGGRVLVEQFDNGPVGGPPGPSEGFTWVDEDDRPTPGKHWKRVDPMTLTPEQRRELGLDELRGDRKRGDAAR